jgi:sulfate adenylyltransferase subunit 1
LKHIIVAVNKMDLIDFSETEYEKIIADYKSFSEELSLKFIDTHFVPISALLGDNVVNSSKKMNWYSGSTLMNLLENTEIYRDKNLEDFRFPVQFVNRPDLSFRGYCGTIASGILHKGDELIVLPSEKRSYVKKIVTYDGDAEVAYPDEAITITLDDEIDISRGDMLVKSHSIPVQTNKFLADVIWFSESALCLQKEYFIKLSTKITSGIVSIINFEVDLETLNQKRSSQLNLNSIGNVTIILNELLPLDTYNDNRKTGAFIIVDRLTNDTVGVGIITSFEKSNSTISHHQYSDFEKNLNALICRDYPEWNCKQI